MSKSDCKFIMKLLLFYDYESVTILWLWIIPLELNILGIWNKNIFDMDSLENEAKEKNAYLIFVQFMTEWWLINKH